MQYCSVLYLAIFLPLVLLIYCLSSKKIRPYVLLIASYIFFYSLSGKLIVYLLGTTLSIHHFGLWLDKNNGLMQNELSSCDKDEKKKIKDFYKHKNFKIVCLATLIHIGLLILLKYSGFLSFNINNLLEHFNIKYRLIIPKYLMPIGISFWTLQALSYVYDIYQGKIKADENILRVALFISFFPGLMEGPIARYNDTANALMEGVKPTYHDLTFGYQRILYGVMKKMVIADRLNPMVITIFNNYTSFDGGMILLGAILYTIQLYCDFSGTIDIVIGSAECFGIKIPENFRQPFFAKNISDFWTRWHITLGTWFRDYIFYPLSLSRPLKKLTIFGRKHLGNHFGPLLAGSIALLAVWLCNGIWHGDAWNYIFFGMYHFVLIVIGNICTPYIISLCSKCHINRNSKIYKGIQILKTTILVIFGELFFRANGLKNGLMMFKKIFTNFKLDSLINGKVLKYNLDIYDYIVVLVFIIVILVISILKEKNVDVRKVVARQNIVLRWLLYYLLILSIVIFGAYGYGYAPVDPLYANF